MIVCIEAGVNDLSHSDNIYVAVCCLDSVLSLKLMSEWSGGAME